MKRSISYHFEAVCLFGMYPRRPINNSLHCF